MGAAGAAGAAQRAPEPIPHRTDRGPLGPFANAGEAVHRNLLFAVERVNRRGGVKLPGGARPLELQRYDGRGASEESLAMLRAALDRHVAFIAQGNSSAVAAAIVEALNKHNERTPDARALLLNYSAVDPVLTNEKCSFWHFRFDAHADMRLAALVEVLRRRRGEEGLPHRPGLQLRPACAARGARAHRRGAARHRDRRRRTAPDRPREGLPALCDEGQASGAQAVLTGNWGNDLTLLIKALREVGVEARIYSFYGNALGAPAAIGEAGVGRVLAVAEWHPNVDTPASRDFHAAFRARFPAGGDYQHARMQVMVEMLAAAIERAGSTEAGAVARALEGLRYDGRTLGGLHSGSMRAADHQFIQPLVVSVMDKLGAPACASTMKARATASAPCVPSTPRPPNKHTAAAWSARDDDPPRDR